MEAPEDGSGSGEPGGPSLSELCAQLVQTRDAGGRLQVGQELLRRLRAPGPGAGPEPDEASLSRAVDELTAWLPASHSKMTGFLLKEEGHRAGALGLPCVSSEVFLFAEPSS